MYIIVNKQVLNVFKLEVGLITHFDKEHLIEIYKCGPGSLGAEKWEYRKIYSTAREYKWFEKENIHWNELDDRVYDFIGVREGYYFVVKDEKHTIVSQLYDTEAAAEAARDDLLTKANKIIARLYKVEI